ncbi:MAG: ATP-binding cassette domain-containing protein [Candidatus Eisenbacteria bacterium]|uniref:ATP-binding cassette domain-containing protein n=1 Tax=Eiseniibacteriota bacterium TaxID=2212470 RepID=A0A538U196_UNCEI|nr:MAG: ATP-binding cassette domain-containing protein [Candidatus Eisenbacteria bacterium]
MIVWEMCEGPPPAGPGRHGRPGPRRADCTVARPGPRGSRCLRWGWRPWAPPPDGDCPARWARIARPAHVGGSTGPGRRRPGAGNARGLPVRQPPPGPPRGPSLVPLRGLLYPRRPGRTSPWSAATDPPRNSMLEVRDVLKSYDGRAVVNRVSFDVAPGEIFALLGPNGAGKTTLIRMITDILKPDAGTIRLDGHDVASGSRAGIAYLPEERGLYRRIKAVETLAYYGELKGLRPAAARQQAQALLERVELSEWALKPVQSLSKGMQQKVQLCTALIGEPRLLILDEPFTGLDPLNTQLFEELLAERRAAGCTVLLSTHQMNKVEQLCDRALMINRGHMVLYGTVRDLRRQHSEHAVLVRTASRVGRVPGVKSVESNNGETILTLERSTTTQSVLRALLDQGVEVESFEVASLPLEDIFVKVVREGLGLDHGQSGPPVAEPVGAGVS